MSTRRLFLDTVFIQALLNRNDQYHAQAQDLLPEVRGAVVSVDTILVRAALQLYAERPDKSWGLTDCISFVVMREHNLTEAATADEHFIQAGHRALMSTRR